MARGKWALIAKRAALAGIKDPVYLCDTFKGVVKGGEHDTLYAEDGIHADTSKGIVEKLIRSVGLTNVRLLTGIFPDETAHLIESQTQFRFCHIDADTYESAKDIMDWLWDRLVPGGVVVYDDYGFQWTPGITKYVNEQTNEADRLVLHNLNGHAIVIKLPTSLRA